MKVAILAHQNNSTAHVDKECSLVALQTSRECCPISSFAFSSFVWLDLLATLVLLAHDFWKVERGFDYLGSCCVQESCLGVE